MFKSVSKNYTPDFLESFMARIRELKPLTKNKRFIWLKGSKLAILRVEEQMIKSNLKLVVSIANSYRPMMSMEDLIQNGNIGLIKAVREFNPELGYRFVFYASMMIRKYIIMGIRNDSGIVHALIMNRLLFRRNLWTCRVLAAIKIHPK